MILTPPVRGPAGAAGGPRTAGIERRQDRPIIGLTTSGGSVVWQPPANGDITAVNTSANSGLTGGTQSGDANLSVATGGIMGSMIADNAVTVAKIHPNVISSVDGVVNDGGNVDLVAGTNITITGTTQDPVISSQGSPVFGGGGSITNVTNVTEGSDTYAELTDTQSSLTANRLIFTNSAGDALTDSGDLVFDGTNFGVGTSSPYSALSVWGATTSSGTRLFEVSEDP